MVRWIGRNLEASTASSILTYVASPATAETRITLLRQGARLVIVDDGTRAILASELARDIRQVVVRGVDGDHNDTLTVDFSGGLSLPGGIDFDGGIGGFDTLRIVGGSASAGRYSATNHSDGQIDVDGTEVRYRNLEPIINTVPVGNFTFNMPPGLQTPNAILQDGGGGLLGLTGSTFESMTFTPPTQSLTIDYGPLGDTLTVNSSAWTDLAAPLTVNGNGNSNTLLVDLANATGSSLTVTNNSGALSGSWTFSNRPTLNFSDIQFLNPADLSITNSAPASITAGTSGASITYTIVVANSGSYAAGGVSLTDVLPPGTTFVALSQSGGPTFNCTYSGGTVSCSIGAFGAGSSATFLLTVVSGTGSYTITNTATVSSGTTDTNPTNNSASASTVVIATPTITVNGPSNSTYGQAVSFTASAAVGASAVTAGTITVVDTATSTTLLPPTSPNANGQVSVSVSNLSFGSHTIQALYAPGPGFAPSLGSASISVSKAPLSVTVNNASKAYGAALPVFSDNISGVVNGDAISVNLSTTAAASSAVGTYPVTAAVSGAALSNYTLTNTPGTLTVTPAALVVTANNASKVYGAPLPVFGYTVGGFVNGDTSAVVSGSPALATMATAFSPVGSYPITAAAGNVAAANYIFSFANGTLSISKAATTTALVNQSGMLVATVAPVSPGAGSPTGTVQFLNGSTAVASAQVSGSMASVPSPGPGAFSASYSGDSNFVASTSGAVTVYAPPAASLSLTSSLNPSTLGQPVTFTASVSTSGGSPTASASGTVQSFDNNKLMGTANLSGG